MKLETCEVSVSANTCENVNMWKWQNEKLNIKYKYV